MARLTAEEKRRILEEQEAEDKRAREAFRLTIPGRFKQLNELAKQVGVSTTITLTSDGVQLEFLYTGTPYIESSLTYDSEEWEVDHVERDLKKIKDEIDAKAARFSLAKTVWARLDDTEKVAVKEFINSLYLGTTWQR